MKRTIAQIQEPHGPKEKTFYTPEEAPSLEEWGPYNLADLSPLTQELSTIQMDWIDATEKGIPLYLVDEEARTWMIAPDNTGRAITTHVVNFKPEVSPPINEYTGPDAWHTLDETYGTRYQVVDPSQKQAFDTNIEAHVAKVRDPVWIRAFHRLISDYEEFRAKKSSNPYK